MHRVRTLLRASGEQPSIDLQSTNIALKSQVNKLSHLWKVQRTQNQVLNKELSKQDSVIKGLVQGATAGDVDSNLVLGLKRELDSALKTVLLREEEIETLKRGIKATKLREIEAELLIYQAECKRLSKLVKRRVKVVLQTSVAQP